ncbi:DUF418 domain-containing protein [Sphingosinicella sp. LHD-64]|uniref:DUF418 domain-containing protein n=1 Tax=Sphingosinicella sp. LHD-64 TaxID=3072139 RepID=UPI00280F4E38|nr:DUF418 domain-containing protein [Sphingosinicella sp. LHD-64]MDQ8755334.1 DUF418 domain-containing protein [Sphingosinicella sp. LHD-64]
MDLIEAGPAGHRPVRQRITHIDSLRGLALMGVIVMNIGSMVMMFNARQVFAAAGGLDIGIAAADLLFMLGKARSCFAFLFGAGFAILLMRAEARGADFRSFYMRRLGVLLLFGLVNQIFLFWGDILATYALLGFLLMLCARWSDAALLKVGLVLAVAPPLIQGLVEVVLGHPIPDLMELTAADRAAHGLAAYTSASYLDAVRENIWLGATRRATATAHALVYDLSIFGLFLLGSWSVRTGVLTDPASHRRLLRRIAWWCVPLGLTLSVIHMGPFLNIRPEGLGGAAVTAAFAGAPILAFGYLAALALLFSHGATWLQAILAPAGRMALTNYLASGAIGGWVFYGYGLGRIDDFGIAGLTGFGLGLFLALALASRLWLSAFPYGPVEWLWRRLSYGVAKGAAHAVPSTVA